MRYESIGGDGSFQDVIPAMLGPLFLLLSSSGLDALTGALVSESAVAVEEVLLVLLPFKVLVEADL